MDNFRDAIKASGLAPPDTIEPGKFTRFPGDRKGSRNRAGWCKLFSDGLGGVYGDYSTGLAESWQAHREKPYSPAEREAFKRQLEKTQAEARAEQQARHDAAAVEAARICQESIPAEMHPYLESKGITPCGARLYGGNLVLPLRDATGKLHSIQTITPDGDKRFLPGGKVQGCYFSIGKPGPVLCIAEGFATAASIHQATGHPVAVAFNAGNLLPVAKVLSEKFPNLKLILCADDDCRTEGNPGLTKANEAAEAVGGLVALPDFGPARQNDETDFNDLHRTQGLGTVKRHIDSANKPEMGNHQPCKENATAGKYAPTVNLIRGSDIIPEPITWLWSGWLAAGKMHILGGAPGTGKTTLAMGLAATVTTGGRWPDGSKAIAGNVIIWSGEDDPADTLVPRLALSKADLSRVYFITDIREGNESRSFDPARDMER
jgi:putative DNA primase/helicase